MSLDMGKIAMGLMGSIVLVFTVMFFLNVLFVGDEDFYNVRYVSGTEYYFGDEGEVAVELYDVNNLNINASCFATAYYPNKTKLFDNESMAINTDSQVYYYQFTVPEHTGVFEYNVKCYWQNRVVQRSKSFHVSNSTEVILDAVNSSKRLRAVIVK